MVGATQICAVSEAVTASELDGSAGDDVGYSGGTDGTITMTFPRLSPGAGGSGGACGGAAVVSILPENDFDGDYRGVSQVSFKVTPQGAYEPKSVILYHAIAGSDREWHHADRGSDAAEDDIVVPLQWDDEKWVFSTGDKSAALWDSWIQAVDVIGVRISAGSADGEEVYTLSDFALDDVGGAVFTPQRVLDYFGVSSAADITDQMKQDDVDTDGDGVKDYLEIWAGTDPNDKNSVFAAKIVDVSGDTVTVEWPAADGVTYTVLKSDSLMGEFAVLDAKVDAANPQASLVDSKISYEDRTATAGAAYYKIVIE